MTTINKILIPTDFSFSADAAVLYGFHLAEVFGASVILYHSFIPFESGFYPLAQSKKENNETEKKLQERLLKIKEQLLKKFKNIHVEVKVDRGPEGVALREYCKKLKTDMVVMGTKGASGLKEVTMGSFTSDVIAKSSCPVLAIPQDIKFKKIQKIIYASNFNKKEVSALQFLMEWNNLLNTKIDVVHVSSPKLSDLDNELDLDKYKKSFEKKLDSKKLQFKTEKGDDVAEVLLKVSISSAYKADILAVSPVKRNNLLEFLFNKSVSKKTAHHIRVPLLSIPL